MERTEDGFQKPPSFAEVNSEFYLPGLSDVTDQDQSQPLTETKLPMIVYLSHLHPKSDQVPLLEELPSTSSRDEAKTEDQNSDSKFKCPRCEKAFGTKKAMFGHMRIHRNRDSKNSKTTSGSKRKSEPETDNETRNLKWGSTKPRGLDRNSPEIITAITLMVLSRNGEIPQDLIKYYSRPEMERKNAAVMEPTASGRQERAKKKVKSGPHVCDKCGKSFPTGQQLGGHMRAHYKPPEDQRAAE